MTPREAPRQLAQIQGLLSARALLALCLMIGIYLAWGSLHGSSLPGCGPASGCDKVLQSRWAHWMGVPVSIPAALVYAALLWATFSVGRTTPPTKQRLAWRVIVVLSVVMTGAAVWFIGLQAFVLKSFCPFCMTAHLSAIVAALLLIRKVPMRTAADPVRTPESLGELSKSESVRLGIGGVAALAVLLAGQVLVERPLQHEVKAIAGSSVVEPPKKLERELRLHGGKFRLLVNELPIIGSANAPHVMVSLFDYTCHYCRDMHHLLLEAHRVFSNQLAIVSLPMPLEADCNRLVKRTPSAHANACQYARLGLAVWRAKPEVFNQFDNWIFAPPSPPPVNEVRQYAEQLVGREPLEQALANDWVRKQIETDVAIYESNSQAMGEGRMPQLVIGAALSAGPLNRIDNLHTMLAEQFGLKPSPDATSAASTPSK